MVFFALIIFGVCWIFWICKLMLLSLYLRQFHLLFLIFFSCIIYFIFWSSNYIYVDCLILCQHLLQLYSLFFNLFFPALLSGNFYWSVFMYTDFSFCIVQYPINTSSKLFILNMLCSSFTIPTLFIYLFYFYISLLVVHMHTHLSIFKSFLNNS